MPYEKMTDEQLMHELALGCKMAMQEIVNRYKKGVYTHVYRCVRNEAEAEDITQEVMIYIYQNASSYSSQKSKFKTFMFRIVSYKLYDYFQRIKKTPNQISEKENNITDTKKNAHQKVELKEMAKIFDDGLKELAVKDRQVLSLRMAGIELSDIPSLLDSTYTAVKCSSSRAIKELREKFTKAGYFYEK